MGGTKDIKNGDRVIGELQKLDLKETTNEGKQEVERGVITVIGALEIDGVKVGVLDVKEDDDVVKKRETRIELNREGEETGKKGMKEVRINKKGIKWSEVEEERDHGHVELDVHETSCGIEHEKGADEGISKGLNGGAQGDSSGLKHEKHKRHQYPLRPEAEDCSYYMRTGICKFGKHCKFNHPLKRNQARNVVSKQREENLDGLGQIECKYYLTGGCKHGDACRYSRIRGETVMAPILEFNFLGLPIRPGERECPHYMRNGTCKFGSNCKFNHPDPTSTEGGYPLPGHDHLEEVASRWSLVGSLNNAALVSPVYLPEAAPPNLEWTGYQDPPLYTPSEMSLHAPPVMSHPASGANIFLQHQHQMLVEEFSEQNGHPESQEHTSGCRFPDRITRPMIVSCPLNDKGLPLRPDKDICPYYSRYGICKHGRACKFDHTGNAVPAA